jgi:copper homeostasis protein
MKYLEIACFNAPSAVIAAAAGADRIELCADRSVGGTTPPVSDLETLRGQIQIPVMVMIRPRGGDFIYSDEEFLQMKEDMNRFRELADGFVFGILKVENGVVTVDRERCEELVKLASALPCTFHRAIDATSDYQSSVREVALCGFKNVLTSGGIQGDVVGGYANLPVFGEEELEIMPGGGVRADVLEVLVRETECRWFHSSGIVGEGEVVSEEEVRAMKGVLRR